MWQTNRGDESIVEWGLKGLDNKTSGASSDINLTKSRLHEVKIDNLSPILFTITE